MSIEIENLTNNLSCLTSQIINHAVYSQINSIERLKIFVEQHVFAVWDFMCLLKALQRRLVCPSVLWFPPKNIEVIRWLNEIIAEEETDLTENNDRASHFEIYYDAMRKIGANTQSIDRLFFFLQNKDLNLKQACESVPLYPTTQEFVLTTFSFFERPIHQLIATFVYAREGITTAMFQPILENLLKTTTAIEQEKLSTFIYYFQRHITLDEKHHFPNALNILANFIRNHPQKLQESEDAAVIFLKARITFLNSINGQFEK